MSKASVKAVIDAAIKQNGTKGITGPVLNSVLNQMVDEVPDVVNDKTTGGTTKAWSAEQGKDLSADVSQLAQEVLGEVRENAQEVTDLLVDKFYNTGLAQMPQAPGTYAGTYCKRIAVTEGETYRITGTGNAGNIKLYTTTDENRDKIRYPSGAMNTRTSPLDLTIQSGEAWLYVNLLSYDASTDKVEKIETEIIPGLTQEVENISEQLDDLEGQEIITYIPQEIILDKYVNTGLNYVNTRNTLATLAGNAVCYIYVSPGEKYRIFGKGVSNNIQLYCFADADRNITYKSGVIDARADGIEITIPDGVAILAVNLASYDASTDKVEQIVTTTEGGYKAYVNDVFSSLAKPFSGKNIVVFGDSITENTFNGKGYADYIAEITGANVINVGIGGAQLRQRTTPVDNPTSTMQAYAALDIVNMVKASCDGVFTQQVNAAEYLKNQASDDNTAIISRLSGIDWSNVWLVIILGGTNDWGNAGAHLGSHGSADINTTLGATNEIIRNLLSTYPQLLIQFVSPIVRWMGYSGGVGDPANWSDVYQNAGEITLKEFVSVLGGEVLDNHIDFEDIYNNLGWNMVNFSQYFGPNDGTHPTKGLAIIGRKIARYLLAHLPY